MTLSILSDIIYARTLEELKMFYLIFCAVLLSFELLGFILYFLPLAYYHESVSHYSGYFGYWEHYYNIKELNINSLFEMDPCAIFSFAFTIIAIILAVVLLIFSIRIFIGKMQSAKPIFILTIITLIVMLVQFVLFYSLDRFTITWKYHGDDYDYSTPTIATNLLLTLFIINIVISIIMCIISSENRSSLQSSPKFYRLVYGSLPISPNNSTKITNDYKEKSNNCDLLLKYNELFKNGVITEEEFNEKKKELL